MNLSRNDWMVINLALRDRIAAEIASCERLEALTRAHIDKTHVPPG